jgi:hypothetical protein
MLVFLIIVVGIITLLRFHQIVDVIERLSYCRCWD